MKTHNLKQNILFSIVYWVLVSNYFLIIRFLNFGEEMVVTLNLEIILQGTFPGMVIGILFGLRESTDFVKVKNRKSFSSALFLNTIIYVVFFVVITFLASLLGNSLEFALNFLFSGMGISVIFHWSICSLLFHFILQMNRKLGQGILLEYITGKYYNPRKEKRIFMFLDLKSSTEIAEKIDHTSYSKLIQDCFAELYEPIIKHNGEIYQYVGDEAVITWKIEKGFSSNNCVELFYSFNSKLESKKEYFLNSYGFYPEFKAGLHYGGVTVAEVGITKSEIAYHGDSLNTAARIQGLCNNYNENLLVSEKLMYKLESIDNYNRKYLGDIKLRGKEEKVKIFALNKL